MLKHRTKCELGKTARAPILLCLHVQTKNGLPVAPAEERHYAQIVSQEAQVCSRDLVSSFKFWF